MGKRRKARESALQILYQLEFDGSDGREAIDEFWRHKRAPEDIKAYSRWLVERVLDRRKEIDEAIQSVSEHWRIDRMALVDRNILRLAACELFDAPHIAAAVVINEAIELAKKFSGPEAADFVNGLLDALRKMVRPEEKKTDEVCHDRAPRQGKRPKAGRGAEKD